MISKQDVLWLAMDDLGEDLTKSEFEGWIRNNMAVLRDSAYEDLERQGVDDITDEDINSLVDEWMDKNLNSRQERDRER
jgi:hypothetical protein